MNQNIEIKKNKDLEEILTYINNHPNKDGIVSMFQKGPPLETGFMYCSKQGGQGFHWTEEEANGLIEIESLVLNKGWDSSGYGFMMRYIQCKIPPSSPDIQHVDMGRVIWRRIEQQNKWINMHFK